MVTEDRLFAAAEDLTAEVERSVSGRALGSELGVVYARRYPELRAAYNLATLLDRYAPRLTVAGRVGQDLLWGALEGGPAAEIDLSDALIEEDPASESAPAEALSRARFTNYRVLRDVELELDRFTALVGPNASGKSTLLDALFRANRLGTRKPLAVFRGRQAVSRTRRRDADQPFTVSLRGERGTSFTYTSGLTDAEPGRFRFDIDGVVEERSSLLATSIARRFGDAVLLRLDARQLARPTYSSEVAPYLRYDGLFLPSVLSALQNQDPDRLDRIVDGVKSVIPQVHAVRMPRAEVPGRASGEVLIGQALEVRFGTTGWTPADQLSEGTLLLLGLFTVLTRSAPPRLVLYDDIDRGLHPNAQRALVEQLLKIVPKACQIVVSTHSPYVIDQLPAEQVRVVRLGDDGYTRVSRLTRHARWEEWRDHMSAGEFWQYAGDEWMEAV